MQPLMRRKAPACAGMFLTVTLSSSVDVVCCQMFLTVHPLVLPGRRRGKTVSKLRRALSDGRAERIEEGQPCHGLPFSPGRSAKAIFMSTAGPSGRLKSTTAAPPLGMGLCQISGLAAGCPGRGGKQSCEKR